MDPTPPAGPDERDWSLVPEGANGASQQHLPLRERTRAPPALEIHSPPGIPSAESRTAVPRGPTRTAALVRRCARPHAGRMRGSELHCQDAIASAPRGVPGNLKEEFVWSQPARLVPPPWSSFYLYQTFAQKQFQA